jgi:hypothetical protein
VPNSSAYLIQHTLYGQFGRPEWKLKLYGGFNHQVVWGNEKEILGEEYELNGFQTFVWANLAKSYSNGSIQKMRVGNHLGSIDMGLTYDFTDIRVFIYRQWVYDAGALYYLANLRDGLNGISISNNKKSSQKIRWNKILLEFLYTKNQAGETWSPHTTSIYEDYYNNGYYDIGWSYKGPGSGTPFITPGTDLREDLPGDNNNYFTNNRVIVLHGGFELNIFSWDVVSKISFSRNYGTYLTSSSGKIWDSENLEAPYGIFPETKQFSGYLQAMKELKNNIRIGLTGAMDNGGLFEDSFGLMASVSKGF